MGDPGICTTVDSATTKLTPALPDWAQQTRWAGLNTKQLPPSFFTVPRKRAIEAKREWQLNPKLVKQCLSGNELVASYKSGRAYPYTLMRAGNFCAPTGARAVKWKLRGARLLVLEWIAYARLVRNRAGLCVTREQLGAVLGLGPDRVGQILRDLCDWFLIRRDPTFVRLGAASSQRANIYRLTRTAAYAFGLRDPHEYPDSLGDVQSRGTTAIGAKNEPISPEKTTSHPENPRPSTTSAEISARARTSGRDKESKVSPAATGDFPLATFGSVPDVRTVPSRPDRIDETCEPVGRLCEPRSADDPSVERDREAGADRARVRDVVDRARRGELEPDDADARKRRRDGLRHHVEREQRDREYDDRRERDRVTGQGPRDFAGVVEKTNAPVAPRPRKPSDDEELASVIERAMHSFHRNKTGRDELTPYEQIALEKFRKRNPGDGGAS